MIVSNVYDRIPDKAGYRLSGIREQVVDGVTLRTNVVAKVNGRNVPVWPVKIGDTWSPDWVEVAE